MRVVCKFSYSIGQKWAKTHQRTYQVQKFSWKQVTPTTKLHMLPGVWRGWMRVREREGQATKPYQLPSNQGLKAMDRVEFKGFPNPMGAEGFVKTFPGRSAPRPLTLSIYLFIFIRIVRSRTKLNCLY